MPLPLRELHTVPPCEAAVGSPFLKAMWNPSMGADNYSGGAVCSMCKEATCNPSMKAAFQDSINQPEIMVS